MSAPRTGGQGLVGDLRNKSKEELCELLLRQEKLLNNKRFIHTLPDKGKKISEFAERVRQALVHVEETERKQNDLSSLRTEFQAQYQEALTRRQPQPRTSAPSLGRTEGATGADGPPEPKQAGPTPQGIAESHDNRDRVSWQQSPMTPQAMETVPDGESRSPRDKGSKESDLVEALARIALSEPSGTEASRRSSGGGGHRNPFLGRPDQKKSHFEEMMERAERSGSAARTKFKPNQLLPNSGSPSPAGSPGGESRPPLSAEARRQRDMKHLDDITSARLPPLHYAPAQLLTLDEASGLMREQTQRQMELEAKMAAQKLSESLSRSMGSYHPEGGSLGAYREVRDDGASDDDQ
ncbi:protein GRINL1A [Alosa alosa]|nr:protein GRINL1A [Alosa alosa]XP_048086961.1 protein GRINL1A [Alosa alosa]XP_048086962.1 protein GRINL1A [Alosa alosa]